MNYCADILRNEFWSYGAGHSRKYFFQLGGFNFLMGASGGDGDRGLARYGWIETRGSTGEVEGEGAVAGAGLGADANMACVRFAAWGPRSIGTGDRGGLVHGVGSERGGPN